MNPLAVVEKTMIWLAVLATAAMMLLTSADALLRYTINQPIIGAYEVTEKYLMVAAIFLGMSYAYRGGAFIRVTFLVDRLPRPLRLAADAIAYLACLVTMVVLLWATGLQAMREFGGSTTLATLPIPTGPSYALVPLGFLAMLVLMVWDARRLTHGDMLLFTQDAPSV